MAHSGKAAVLKFNKSNIRLVICADTEKGRTPYFDSKAIRQVEEVDKDVIRTAPKPVHSKIFSNPTQQKSSVSQPKQTSKYHFQKLGSDIKVLEEMMFGTGVIAFKGLTVKVHLLRSPPQLLVSNVFIPEKLSRDSTSDIVSNGSSLAGFAAEFSSRESNLSLPKEKHAKSIPLDNQASDLQCDYSTDDDNGLAYLSSSGSFRTSVLSTSGGSYSSLHRRWMRAHRTSLDGQHGGDSGFICEGSLIRPRRQKLAIGIIFESPDEKDEESNELFQSFFFSHFALIEGHFTNLRSVVEKAFFNSRNFLPTVMEALDTFRNDIYDLCMACRLPEPVWLTMISAPTYKTEMCEKFMGTLVSLVTKYDNKKYKFFVSSLLSAVLTHHLAWVATVTPANGIQSSTYLDKHTAKWVDALTKSHPYNPLWAQLGDLFGAIGFPCKISRIVVIGKKADIVKQFLFILSYFIRCSEVRENTDIQCLTNIVNDMKFELSSSSSPSDKSLTNEWESYCTSSVVPVVTSKQANCDSVNEFESKINTQSQMTRLVGSHAEDGIIDFKCFTTPTVVSIEESYIDFQTNSHFEISDNSSNGTCFDKSCNHKPIYSICDVDVNSGSTSESSGQQKIVDKSVCNVLCKNYQEDNLKRDNSVILPIKSNSVCKTVDFITSETSFMKYPTEVLCSAADLTGISDLYIFAPRLTSSEIFTSPVETSSEIFTSPVETSSEIFTSPVETRYHAGGVATDTENTVRKFSHNGEKSFLNSQPVGEVKVKSKLAQQLDESLHYNGIVDNKVMTSTRSRHPLEVKRPIDSTSKLNLLDPVNAPEKNASRTETRLVAPTEFNRRRHLSSSGSVGYEVLDPRRHCTEIKLPDCMYENGQWHVQAFDRNFGHSLLADYTDHYMTDFVLQGTSDTNYKSRLFNDLQMSVKHSVLDEPISEAICVIADTDNWTVEVASSKVITMSTSGCTTWTSSHLVADLIMSVVEVFKLKMSAEFCLMHLEDRLQDIYFKSVVLSENMRATAVYSQQELTRVLGWNSSDLPLLLAVAGAHTPTVAH